MDIKNWRRVVAIWGPLAWSRMSVNAFVQPRRPPRRLHRLPARPDESWAAKNPEVLAFVCGGLFGLVPSASTFLAAPPDELTRAITTVATTPIWTSGRWPFLGFIPVLGLAASGALAEFTTIRVLTASTVAFGLVSQASGRVVGELGTGWHITI